MLILRHKDMPGNQTTWHRINSHLNSLGNKYVKQIKHFTCNSDCIESLFFILTIASHFPSAYPLTHTSPLSNLLPCCLLQSVWVLC